MLEATNIAHFGARRNDVDKYHRDATDFADRLSRALRRVLVPDRGRHLGPRLRLWLRSARFSAPLYFKLNSLLVKCYFILIVIGQESRALAPYVAQLVGVDISPRMVEVYNARANTKGSEQHEMRAVGSLAKQQ